MTNRFKANGFKAFISAVIIATAATFGAALTLIVGGDNSPVVCPVFQGANLSPHTTPTLGKGCTIAQTGRFTNGDTYTVFPDGSVITR